MKWNYDPKEGGEQDPKNDNEAGGESTQDNQETTEQGAAEEETE